MPAPVDAPTTETTRTETVPGAGPTRTGLAPTDAGLVDPVPAVPTTTTRQVDDNLLVEDDLLVEEVSIDGMCGVY